MNDTQIAEILDLHAKWLRDETGGRWADLGGANLVGANLARADLAGADFHGADLTGANLARANFTGANFTGANFTGANFTGANLARANLAGADFHGADLTRANLARANLGGAYLGGANLVGANLVGADLGGAAGIRWGQVGPVGKGRRIVTAWAHDSLAEPIIGGGCFRGTFAEFRAKVSDTDVLPWEWGTGTPEQVDRWRAECLAAADLLELAVTA